MATADWTQPKLTSPYVDFLNNLNLKISDCITLSPTGTNIIANSMRWERTLNLFQEYVGAVWVNKVLSVAGGGTGATTGADARVNLGLGTMSLQNHNGVNIVGGSITGTNLDANFLTSGTIPAARFPDPLPALNGGNLTNLNAGALAFGQVPNAARLGTGAVGSGLKYLADNLTWKDISMAPRVAPVTLSMAAGSALGIVALPYTVQVGKSYIIASTGLVRNSGSTGITQITQLDVFFSDGAGTVVTAGPATHIRGSSPLSDSNALAQSYRLQVVEWL